MNHPNLRTFVYVWAVMWLAIAAMAMVAGATAHHGDAVIQLHASGDGEATLDSLTARVESIAISGAETVVVLSFSGREADGDTIEFRGGSRLRLDDGTGIAERAGRADGRTVTLHYDPIPASRTVVEVALPKVALGPAPVTEGSLNDVGSFTIRTGHMEDAISRAPSAESQLSVSAPFGSGTVVFHTAIVSGGQIVLRGSLPGYHHEQLPVLVFETPELRFSDGTKASWIDIRLGFPGDLVGIEIRFATSGESSGEATLTLKIDQDGVAELRASMSPEDWDLFSGGRGEPSPVAATLTIDLGR